MLPYKEKILILQSTDTNVFAVTNMSTYTKTVLTYTTNHTKIQAVRVKSKAITLWCFQQENAMCKWGQMWTYHFIFFRLLETNWCTVITRFYIWSRNLILLCCWKKFFRQSNNLHYCNFSPSPMFQLKYISNCKFHKEQVFIPKKKKKEKNTRT